MDPFFISSKLIWALIRPGNLLALTLILGGALTLIKIGWIRRIGKFLIGLTTFAVLLIAFFPVGDWAIRPLESQYTYPSDLGQVNGIIVLGGGISLPQSVQHQSMQLNSDGDRIAEMLALMAEYRDVPVIYTGGSGEITIPEKHSIGYLKRYLSRLNMPLNRITFETKARNTYQNAKYTRRLVGSVGADERWALVTSAYHMPRAKAVFDQAGWNTTPVPVDFKASFRPHFAIAFDLSENLALLDVALHEYLGILAYKITGRID